jgi:hypothetical protein
MSGAVNPKAASAGDGGPAFPARSVTADDCWPSRGMTLRDFFAAKAMQGDLANSSSGCLSRTMVNDNFREIAELYYRLADAMLKARAQ